MLTNVMKVWVPAEYLVNATDICPKISRKQTAKISNSVTSEAPATSIIPTATLISLIAFALLL